MADGLNRSPGAKANVELGYVDDAASGLRNRVRGNLHYLERRERAAKDRKGPGVVWRPA